MKFTKKQIFRFLIVAVLCVLMLFANFFAVRAMIRLGVDVYFYDKLQVALSVAGVKGMNEELAKIRANEKMPRVLKLAAEFDAKKSGIVDLDKYLDDKVDKGKREAELIRKLRSLAITILTLVFCWQLFAKWLQRRRCKVK